MTALLTCLIVATIVVLLCAVAPGPTQAVLLLTVWLIIVALCLVTMPILMGADALRRL